MIERIKGNIWNFYATGASAALNATGLVHIFGKNRIRRILVYHYIDDYSIESFRKQIAYYSEHYKILSLSEFTEALSIKKNKDDNILCITFDDAYKNIYLNAAPVLDSYDVKPCIFIPVGFMETPKKIEYIKNNIRSTIIDAPMSWEEMKDLADRGYEVGSHGWAHVDFGKAGIDYELEFLESKRMLQDKLGREVKYFAFPFGKRKNITQTALDKAKEYGYSRAFSGIKYDILNDDFLLPRTPVSPRFSKKTLKCILAGCFDNRI